MTPQLRQLLSAYMQGLNRAITLVRTVRESPYISDNAKALAESAMAQIQTTIDAIRPTPKPFHPSTLSTLPLATWPSETTPNTSAHIAAPTPRRSASSTRNGTGTTARCADGTPAHGASGTRSASANCVAPDTSAVDSRRSFTRPQSASRKAVAP